MNKLYKVEPVVLELLNEVPETRGNDTLLQKEVMLRLNPAIADMPFTYVMDHRRELGLPPFESIRRSRAKLQSKYEDLKPCVEIQEARAEQEEEYLEYVRN